MSPRKIITEMKVLVRIYISPFTRKLVDMFDPGRSSGSTPLESLPVITTVAKESRVSFLAMKGGLTATGIAPEFNRFPF